MTCLTCLEREDRDFASGCGCDHSSYPPCDHIAPGLATLPRQALGFPELREALLSAAGRDTRLAGWTARGSDDLGVMLLESWAYVLDIVNFYSRRQQARGYLSTAPDARTLGRLAALIGYRPRPATAGSATIAALASIKGPAVIPAGMQIRSQGVPGIPPQVFEASATSTVHPQSNSWSTAPVRSGSYHDLIAFAPGAPGVAVGNMIAVLLANAPHAAARVTSYGGKVLSDGADYRVATLDPPLTGLAYRGLDEIELYVMAQSATPSTFPVVGGTAPAASSSRTEWTLDGVYPQLASSDLVVVETVSGSLVSQRLTSVGIASIELGTSTASVAGKATKVVLPVALELRRLHFRAVTAGGLTNPAMTSLPAIGFAASSFNLTEPIGLIDPVLAPTRLMVVDKGDPGLLVSGEIEAVQPAGGIAELGAVIEGSASTLSLPATFHGNLIELTRGQTVANEVLGSADASKAYQRFKLARKPLTYFPDPVRPGMVRPELEVRVNGILWTRVDSFLSAPAGQQVYLVRQTVEGETEVVFGDAVRPQSGVGNVTATYRWGAGALAPPPGKLTQVVGKVPNLARIIAPLTVRGGADGETPAEIRKAAPRSTLARGRAVSVADYAAIVSTYPGVIASAVDWSWLPESQRAGVSAWIICAGGDVSVELAAALALAGDPLAHVTVAPAVPVAVSLAVDVVCDPAYLTSDIIAAIELALSNPSDGLLAPLNAAIGGAIFRSRIVRAVMAVTGVVAVRSIIANGAEMPAALQAAAGAWLSFTPTVGAS